MTKKIVGNEEAMYLLVLHKGKALAGGKFLTNCGRNLPRMDPVDGVVAEKYKCKQCFGKEGSGSK